MKGIIAGLIILFSLAWPLLPVSAQCDLCNDPAPAAPDGWPPTPHHLPIIRNGDQASETDQAGEIGEPVRIEYRFVPIAFGGATP